MLMEYEGLLVTALAGVIVYMVWDTYFMGKVEMVKSTVDGHEYSVRSLPDKQAAADLLADIRAKLDTLVMHLQKMYPDDDRTKRIIKSFRSEKISEGGEDTQKYTSYSVNKGEKIVFCLRSRDKEQKLVDLNTMVFVAIHELAHIGTESIGHTDDFWHNMRYLLEEGINVGVYTKQDFSKKPVKYCGINVTSSPLDS